MMSRKNVVRSCGEIWKALLDVAGTWLGREHDLALLFLNAARQPNVFRSRFAYIQQCIWAMPVCQEMLQKQYAQ